MPANVAEELYQAVSKKLFEYGDKYVTELRQQVIDNGNLASGTLYNSFVFQVTHKGQQAVLEIYAEDYFKYIDQGRKPGSKMPPIDSIIQWIEIRGIRPRGLPDSSHGLERTKRSLAFVIGRFIGLNGLKPINALKNTNQKIEKQLWIDVDQSLAEATAAIVARQTREAFRNNNVTTKYN